MGVVGPFKSSVYSACIKDNPFVCSVNLFLINHAMYDNVCTITSLLSFKNILNIIR